MTEPPSLCYLVCSTPRSGSSLLCESLWLTGVAGRPAEHFLTKGPDGESPPEQLRRSIQLGSTANGVFGVKVMWEHLGSFVDLLRRATGIASGEPAEVLAAALPGLRFIHTTRQDTVAQAVSLAKAVQSGRWFDTDRWLLEGPAEELAEKARHLGLTIQPEDVEQARRNVAAATTTNFSYDFEQINGFHRAVLADEQNWQRFFAAAGVTPHDVTYERLAADYRGVALGALDFLGLPHPDRRVFDLRAMRRQSDAVNDDWVARFRADLAAPTT